MSEDFTVGVEEEFFLCDAETYGLRPEVDRVLVRGQQVDAHVEPELQRWQVETGTGICTTLDEVRGELLRLRRDLREVAAALGCRVLATATHPLATLDDAQITQKVRYLRMAERFGQLARDQLVCGCHIHVGIADRDVAVQAMSHARVWLGPLVALSGNSPFWMGEDTGYASYRNQVWSRWPTAGPPEVFATRAEYDAMVDGLLGTGVIPDLGMVYLDVRPSARYDTLEFRVSDVCLTVDEAVLIAGLTRALARTAVEAALAERPLPLVRPELIRVAHWRAARSGLTEELVDLSTGRPVPAPDALWALVDHVRLALEAHGDLDEVRALVEQVLAEGTGAARQRAAHQRRGELRDTLELLARETEAGLD